MPGTYIFKPIEANLSHDTDWLGNMDPYCAYMINNKRIKGEICKNGGMHPFWKETTSVPIEVDQPACVVELMDKDRIIPDDSIGTFVIDLNEVKSKGLVSRWYPIYHKNKPAGEILFETAYQPEMGQVPYQQAVEIKPAFVATPLITESKPVVQETITTEKVITEKPVMAPVTQISQTTSQYGSAPLSQGTTTFQQGTSNLNWNQQQATHTVYHSTITSKELTHSGKGCLEDPLYGKTVGIQNVEHIGGIPNECLHSTGHQHSHLGQSNLSQPLGTGNLNQPLGTSNLNQPLGTGNLSQPLGTSNLNQPLGSQNRPLQGDVNQPFESDLNLKSGQGNLLNQGNLSNQGNLLNQGNLPNQGNLLNQGNVPNQGNFAGQGNVNRENLPL